MDGQGMGLKEPPILVTGCARSGTSMTAGILSVLGAWGGEMSGPTKHNRKGMFENAEIRSIVKLYLHLCNVDPKGQYPLPNINDLRPIANWKNRITGIMERQGCPFDSWFYKGAKMCLIWPIWHNAFPKAKWIIVRRSDDDIVYSCMRTGFMNNHSTEKGWHSWVDHHKENFKQMHEAGLQIKELWPSKFVEGDYTELKEVMEWAGLPWNEESINAFVDKKLFHRGGK